MSVELKPGAPRKIEATMRSSILGELHQGEIYIEERHPVLRETVRMAVGFNAAGMLLLWLAFRVKSMFPPHEAPFMNAIGFYFLFGVIYGAFAQMLLTYGRFVEKSAITRSLTHNRSYKWHARYDTENMSNEELRKVATAPSAHRTAQKPEAVGAGAKIFSYSMLFAACGFICCGLGTYMFFHTMF